MPIIHIQCTNQGTKVFYFLFLMFLFIFQSRLWLKLNSSQPGANVIKHFPSTFVYGDKIFILVQHLPIRPEAYPKGDHLKVIVRLKKLSKIATQF
jgi:hypothetical protein